MEERNGRSNGFDKSHMVVKGMVGKLKDIHMEILGRIHPHHNGIGVVNITRDHHGLSVKGHTENRGTVVFFVRLFHTAHVI